MRVWFDHAKGLVAEGGVKGFEVAGSDGHFEAATARIEGESVLVRTGGVTAPRAVRYAWPNATDANLANAAGLPARTFEVMLKR